MGISPQSFLSIESAIRGGSIALFHKGWLIASRIGGGDRSRSEDLLSDVAEMMEAIRFDKRDLEAVVVSRGPGSFTGIRIGIATAMGLADSLDIPIHGVGLFDLVFAALAQPPNSVLVVPVGRSDVAWQSFASVVSNGATTDSPRAGTISAFIQFASEMSDGLSVFCHPAIYATLSSISDAANRLRAVDPNLAASIGTAFLDGFGSAGRLEPIYVSNSSFSP